MSLRGNAPASRGSMGAAVNRLLTISAEKGAGTARALWGEVNQWVCV
jgi:hypothetical protein